MIDVIGWILIGAVACVVSVPVIDILSFLIVNKWVSGEWISFDDIDDYQF